MSIISRYWPPWVHTWEDVIDGRLYVRVSHGTDGVTEVFDLATRDRSSPWEWAHETKNRLIREQRALDAVTRRLKK